ncbi:MAG: aspartate kinase [Desulfobacteraceae bacterium]|nr:MAG: aspartate kinase [Desulfobacteraceae bacterium]
MGNHTVEKIGGTSMSQFKDVLDNILIGNKTEKELYNRIIVVSAYGGVTDMLLEYKKSTDAGVYALFSDSDNSWAWSDAISKVGDHMCRINGELEELGLDRTFADQFVKERIEGVRSCMLDLTRLCSYGNFHLDEHLMTIREMLSAVGEAHSAHNTFQILTSKGINARLVDLSGWRETANFSFDDKIRYHFQDINLETELPVVTGYTHCKEGIMATYDRGYSEITFSKIAVLTQAREGIIHKEFHLSSGDPKLIGTDKVRTIGQTNYDVTDQLSDLGMEAIHPQAAKGMRKSDIPLRIKNAFEPEHPGTLIKNNYKSESSKVEIIAGRKKVTAIECWDQEMAGRVTHDMDMLKNFAKYKIRYLAKDTNANTLTHYVAEPLTVIKKLTDAIQESFPGADILLKKVSLISAIGSNMADPGIFFRAVKALDTAGISVLAVHKCMRDIDVQFVIEEDDFEKAVCALHQHLVENKVHAD